MHNSEINKNSRLLENKRYKIIADYPNPIGSIGDIIYMSLVSDNSDFYKNYPHIFQKLEWWEERIQDDMPKYLKNPKTNEVYELLSYHRNNPFALIQYNDVRIKEHLQLLLPATEDDYKSQKTTSVEQLLRPRYIVIADYPGNVQPIGHIHQAIGDEESIRYWCEQKEKYPQVFRRLDWYEHRTDSELPRYMKYADNPDMVFQFLASHQWTPGKIYVRDAENYEGWEYKKNMFPATQQEFENQPKYRD